MKSKLFRCFIVMPLALMVLIYSSIPLANASLKTEQCPGEHTWELVDTIFRGITPYEFNVSSCPYYNQSHPHRRYKWGADYNYVCVYCGAYKTVFTQGIYYEMGETCLANQVGSISHDF